MPKERLKGLPQTPSSIDQVGSNDDDTMVLLRPISRKVEKSNQKRNDGEKDFREYLAKKFQYVQESHEQEKEALRIKVERVQVVEQRIDIEKERLHLEIIKKDERIMMRDSSGMSEKQSLFFWENLQDQILARQKLE